MQSSDIRRTLVLFDPMMGTNHVLQLQVWVKLGVLHISQSSRMGESTSESLTSKHGTRWGWGVLPICRDAVGVFFNPSRPSHRSLDGVVLHHRRDTVGVFYCPCRPSQSSLVGVVLLNCRDVVSVFYSHSRRSHRLLLEGVLPHRRDSRCIQLPQSTKPQVTRWGSLTPPQRCSRCILQSQPTGPQDTRWGSLILLQRCSRCILQPHQKPSLCYLRGFRPFQRVSVWTEEQAQIERYFLLTTQCNPRISVQNWTFVCVCVRVFVYLHVKCSSIQRASSNWIYTKDISIPL